MVLLEILVKIGRLDNEFIAITDTNVLVDKITEFLILQRNLSTFQDLNNSFRVLGLGGSIKDISNLLAVIATKQVSSVLVGNQVVGD